MYSRTDHLPTIPTGQSHFTAKLSIRVKGGSDIASTNFTFFSCSSHSSCSSCVASSFPCDWCVDGKRKLKSYKNKDTLLTDITGHRCTHDSSQHCRNDILVTGVNRIGPSIRSGPAFCPRVHSGTSESTSEILIPSGQVKGIRLKIDNGAQFMIQTRFFCQFNIEGRIISVSAQIIRGEVLCDETEFSYPWR